MTKVEVFERLEALQDLAVGLISAKSSEELFEKIVNHVCHLMVCDAASFYLFNGKESLHFLIAKNKSVRADFRSATLPVDGDSLAAYVFRDAKPLIVDDVYNVITKGPYKFNPRFDERIGYRTRSMLSFPLKNRRGEVLGVIQAINKKDDHKTKWPSGNEKAIAKMPSFDDSDVKLLEALASIASASLENAKLYEEIENLFDGFVKASVHAIESRDLITLGHSERVTILTMETARLISESSSKPFKDVKFTRDELDELRYATLLHDFGKIAVPEYVIQKEEKLSTLQKSALRIRIEDFKKTAQMEAIQNLFKETSPDYQSLEQLLRKIDEEFEALFQGILVLNKPTVLDEDKSKALKTYEHMKFISSDSQETALLTEEDVRSLSVMRGSLSDDERQLMQDHVEHSFKFLREIPWTSKYKRIPDLARAHHEMLDGSGYPLGLKGEEIDLKVRIMSVCDIYDALVAADRSYKPALPTSRALDILHSEAERGRIDVDVLKVFTEKKVYETPRFLDLVNGVTKASDWKKSA